MNFSISSLTIREVDSFMAVFSEVLSTDFPGYSKTVVRYFLQKAYTKENFSYWLKLEYKTIFIAKDSDSIVGFAVVDQPYGGVSFCRWLGVLKSYQKKGVGTQLIHAWLQSATSLGCHKAEIAAQPEAKKFYEKVGLTLEGKRKLSYFGIDQYVFGKVIGTPTDEAMTKY